MTGEISVTTSPPFADVELIDAKGQHTSASGKTPLTIPNLNAGTYQVKVSITENDQMYCGVKSTEVKDGETATVDITILTPSIKKSINDVAHYTEGLAIIFILITLAGRIDLVALDNLTRLIIFISCSGALGGLAFNMYVLTYHVGRDEDYKPVYESSYYLRPFIGILYGVFSFFFVVGGLMTLSTNAALPQNLYTTNAFMFYIALAFLVGFAEEPFSIQLKALAEALLKEPPSDSTKK
jgi:hypothetical protein